MYSVSYKKKHHKLDLKISIHNKKKIFALVKSHFNTIAAAAATPTAIGSATARVRSRTTYGEIGNPT